MDEQAEGVLQALVEELRLREQHYRSIFETAANMITSVDVEGTIVDCNPRTIEVVGYLPEELIGCPMGKIIHPEDLHKAEAALAEILSTGHSYDKHYRMVHKDGGLRRVRINSSGLKSSDGSYVRTICIIEDVTEAQRLDEERRQVEERVQRAQMLESLGVLAGGVAHDFNNILVAILGTASLARMELPEGEPLSGTLREIEVAATRASELCDQLLACAGRGQTRREILDLNQLVQEMQPLLRSSVPDQVELSVELSGGSWLVHVDPTQLRQVLLNLVVNAGEACTGSGARVLLRTDQVTAGRSRLDAALAGEGLPVGGYAALEVRDDGVGMEPEVAERLFDPFFTTKFAGRGLGLSASLGIVCSHGGAVEMVTQPGEGTLFRILLPIAEGAPRDLSWQTAESGPVSEAAVLVVDDDPLVRRTVRRVLHAAGHDVIETGSGAEALGVLDSGRPVDVVLLDLTMPEMSGVEVWRRMGERGLSTPVVVMSGFAEDEMLRRFGDGLAGLVRKPFTAQQITRAIEEALFGSGSGSLLPVLSEATVLVVDDDAGVRETCGKILRSAGYQVRTAADGSEALQQHDATVDLVLLDMLMPVMDGSETFERLLALDPRVRVVFFCGSRIDSLRPELEALGARGAVRKPLTAEELIATVEAALA